MDLRVKQRIIGIVVLIILLAVLIPLLFTGSKKIVKEAALSAVIPNPPSPPVIQPSPKPPAWVIQLASFSNQVHATQLVSKLTKRGFPASMKAIVNGQNYIYQVIVGPELNRDKAQALAKDLQKSLHLKGLIIRAQI